jgi:hypothetical protein
MAKFHINAKGEVKQCRAQIKCRLGGASGNENHFSNKADAEQAVQAKFAEMYQPLDSVRRSPTPSEKRATTNAVNSFKKNGLRVSEVPSVVSYKFDNGLNFDVSNVDLLDEKPDPEFLAKLRSGKLKAITF